MQIEHISLLDAPKDYAIVQCISADCAMGVTSNGKEIPCLALEIRKSYPSIVDFCKSRNPVVGGVVSYVAPDNRVIFNLVTKDLYYVKQTQRTMYRSLVALRALATSENIFKIAVPRLGSGLDKLNWTDVSEMISETLESYFFEVLLCTGK